jgi:ornithine decarboxylase
MHDRDPALSLEFLRRLSHQTPFFVFSKARIVEEYRRFQKCFPSASVYYAIKANPERELLRLLADVGCGFEAASIHELSLLKALTVPPDKIIYGSCVKPSSQIREFYTYGVRRYSADSFSELEKLAADAPGAKVFLRIRVEDAGSAFKFSEKFGTGVANAVPMLVEAERLGLDPHGLSFHVGSQASDLMAWANALDTIAPALTALERAGIPAAAINIGGGFPCGYASGLDGLTLEGIATATLSRLQTFPYRPQLVLEPGRRIVATSAVLVCTVIGRIKRGRKTWLFLDAGVYNALFEALACQASIRYTVTSLSDEHSSEEMFFALAGPTGDGLDIITRQTSLPKNIGIGDKLVIHDTGAYSLALSSEFNGFAKPDVYFI